MQTLFLDFEFAVDENTEEILWNLHTSINSEYRRILGRLKSQSQAVERRKTEKLYTGFLRIAQKFYQGYIQRLSARYDIPELKRVARGIEVEQMAGGDLISPVPSELNAKVLRSCHATLIRLGDLARYRVQAKHKNSGYDMALTYYTLAQHLLPKSGFAFHQMGIVSLDQGNHLDGVYHFYRAWAIKFPHPNAKTNLEMEFKSLQQPSSNKSKHTSSGPQDAFIMWFVRLHALFYKGEVAPQHKELEREVIHRLEMAAGNGSCRDIILKMSLINMAAQHIAALKCSGKPSYYIYNQLSQLPTNNFTENKSSTAVQFYRYASSFNVKFLTTFAAVLEANLKDNMAKTDDPADEEDEEKAQLIDSLLPSLRVYGMWIGASREELFTQASAGEDSLVGNMMDTIGRVFTLMCVETYNRENLVSCPYLLPEDLDILGFQPLSETAVPEPCRSFCGQNGKVKPHLYSPEERLQPQAEKLARILDILRCAYFLAEDPSSPMSYRVVDNWLLFEFSPVGAETKPQKPVEVAQAPRKGPTAAPATINVQKRRSVQTNNQERQKSPRAPNTKQPDTTAPVPPPAATAAAGPTTSTGVPPPPANKAGEVGDAESTVINMLAPFLKPPTPQPRHSSPEPDATTYGAAPAPAAAAGTTTLLPPPPHLVSHSGRPDPSPTRSIPSGRFEPLPWEWFNTPKPVRGDDSPLSAAGMSPITPGLPPGRFDDPFSGPSTPIRADSATNNSGGGGFLPRVHSHGSVRAADMGVNLSGGSTAEHNHRAALLQSFGGARPPSTSASASAARTSPFGQWGENKPGSVNGGRQGIGAPPGLRPHEMMSQSSSAGSLSQFSHPSSLYHGTPGSGYGQGNVQGQMYGGAYKENHFSQQQQQQQQRFFQAENTTSSYDEAIFRAAYEGKR